MMLRLLLFAALGACHDGSANTVRVDLTALHQHAAQVGLNVGRIELVVSAPDLTPWFLRSTR